MKRNFSLLGSLKALAARTAPVKAVKTMNLEPNWKNMVRFFHSVNDVVFWKKTLADDETGWYAAVGAAHPDPKIKKLAMASPKYDPNAIATGMEASQVVKAETESDPTYDSEAEEKKRRAEGDYPEAMFVMVTVDVEVRKTNIKAWEDIQSTDDLFGNQKLVKDLERAMKDVDNLHFVEATPSDEEGNIV